MPRFPLWLGVHAMYETTNVGLRGGGKKARSSPSRSESEESPGSEDIEGPAMMRRQSRLGADDQEPEDVDDPPANIMQELDANEARRLRAIEEARQDMVRQREHPRLAGKQAKDKISGNEQPSNTQSTSARAKRSCGRNLILRPDSNYPGPRPQSSQNQSQRSDRHTRVPGHPYYGDVRLPRMSTTGSQTDRGYRRPLPAATTPAQSLQLDPQSEMGSAGPHINTGPSNIQGSPRAYPIAPGMYGMRYADTPALNPRAAEFHPGSLPATPSVPPSTRISTVDEATAAERLRRGPPFSEFLIAAEWQSREAERQYREDPEMQQRLIRERDALWRILRYRFNVPDQEILWMLAGLSGLPGPPTQHGRDYTG